MSAFLALLVRHGVAGVLGREVDVSGQDVVRLVPGKRERVAAAAGSCLACHLVLFGKAVSIRNGRKSFYKTVGFIILFYFWLL